MVRTSFGHTTESQLKPWNKFKLSSSEREQVTG